MFDKYISSLRELVSLKSVSADPKSQSDIKKTAHWLADTLAKSGFKSQVFEGYANPIMVASYETNPKYKTCLIYGHYDVQPASKDEGWDSEPFELTERNGRLYGRGSMDDKGQLLIHILAISQLIKEKKLGYNIKFISEGNEEVGSPFIGKFIEEHKDLLSCDFILISDGEMTMGKPTIELGFRGSMSATLILRTSNNELHSGLYGGAAPNAAHEAAKFIAGLYDRDNKVTIDGFYNSAKAVDTSVKIPFDMNQYEKNSGTRKLLTEPGYDFYTQVGGRPTVQVTGVQGGYVGEGYRNSIPAKVTIKINFRIVRNQTPEEIEKLFKAHVERVIPDYVEADVIVEDKNEGVKVAVDNEYVAKARKVIKEVYGQEPLRKYVGGSEPVATDFDGILKKPQVLVPFANEDGAMHGMNENMKIENAEKGFEFSLKFFEK